MKTHLTKDWEKFNSKLNCTIKIQISSTHVKNNTKEESQSLVIPTQSKITQLQFVRCQLAPITSQWRTMVRPHKPNAIATFTETTNLARASTWTTNTNTWAIHTPKTQMATTQTANTAKVRQWVIVHRDQAVKKLGSEDILNGRLKMWTLNTITHSKWIKSKRNNISMLQPSLCTMIQPNSTRSAIFTMMANLRDFQKSSSPKTWDKHALKSVRTFLTSATCTRTKIIPLCSIRSHKCTTRSTLWATITTEIWTVHTSLAMMWLYAAVIEARTRSNRGSMDSSKFLNSREDQTSKCRALSLLIRCWVQLVPITLIHPKKLERVLGKWPLTSIDTSSNSTHQSCKTLMSLVCALRTRVKIKFLHLQTS